jgi:polar amino acid transport system substrate-binding protein
MTHSTDGRTKSFLRMLISVSFLVIVLFLAGCGDEATPESRPTPTPSPTSAPAEASVPARIRARGSLVVGLRYDLPPFGYVMEEGALAGFDVDLGRELARRWLGDPEAVAFRQVRSDTAAEHVLAGDVDLVLTALVHAQDVEGQVDFGPPLFEDGQALLVRATDVPTVSAPASLGGRLVGVVAGSPAEGALAATVSFTPTLVAYTDFEQAVDALTRGEVDAVADLRRRLVRGMSRAPETVIVGQYSRAFLAPAYASRESGLADLVALTLQEMFSDGSFSDLYGRWFPGDAAPEPEIWPGAAAVSLDAVLGRPSAPDTIAAIQTRGRLRVAMVDGRLPFAYLDAAGEPAGYEVHLVRLMAERWLGDRTAVDFLPVAAREEGLRMVASGEADMLVGTVPHTREAELEADFSLTTYVAGEGLMVRAGAALGGVAGLDGQTVAAVNGTEGADVLRRAAQGAGISVVVLPKPTLEDAVAALEAGEVLAIVGERVDMLGPAYATPGLGVTGDRLTQVPMALLLPQGDSAFRDLVNLTLQAMAWDGQFAAVYGEWFDDEPLALPPWPGEPAVPLRIPVGTP